MKQLQRDQKGFSLLEILIALSLAAAILGAIIVRVGDTRRDLKEALNKITRPFASLKAKRLFRNSLVRLYIKLGSEENPNQSYTLQYGPQGSFVLPRIQRGKNLTESEREEEEKKSKALNKKFNRITDFHEEDEELIETIRFIGIGTADQDELITDGDVSLFTYPTGEKDSAIIILASEVEVGYLEVNPFLQEYNITYKTLEFEEFSEEEIYDKQRDLADEVFLEWKGKENSSCALDVLRDKVAEEKGFSLIEVIIALFIFAIFLTTFSSTMGLGVYKSSNMRERSFLKDLCQKKMNEILGAPPRLESWFTSKTTNKEF